MSTNIVSRIKRIQWKSRKSLTLIAIFLLAIILLRIKEYRLTSKTHIAHSKASAVWEYVADFSNMKRLNPTIQDFVILHDAGNFENWKYTVEYNEVSAHWPYLTSATLATYEVNNVRSPIQAYHIISNHSSCTVFGTICLTTYSNYDFIQIKDKTIVTEVVDYQCPVLFSYHCRKEIEHQRNAIAANLMEHFSKSN